METNKPKGGHWALDLWRSELGGTRSPEPFLSVTTPNYGTTQKPFILRGKAHLVQSFWDSLFLASSESAVPAASSNAQQPLH